MPEISALERFKGKYCRMCGAEFGQGVSIFGEEGKRLRISEKIRKTLTVLILEEDLLPKKICTECCSNLEEYTHYRETVLDAQEKLSTIAKSLLSASASPEPDKPLGRSSQAARSSSSSKSTSPPIQQLESNLLTCKDCGRKFGNRAGLESHMESDHPQDPVEAMEAHNTENGSRSIIETAPSSNDSNNHDQNSDHEPPDSVNSISAGEVAGSGLENLGGTGAPQSVVPVSTQFPSPDSSPDVVGYVCELCDKVLASSGSYHNHVMTAHKGRKFSCPYCPYSYSQKCSLTIHIRAHHASEEPTNPKSHICDICQATFHEKKFLTRHRATHTEERLYECNTCNKFYKTQKCLNKHRRVHLDANAFVCPECGKGFNRKHRLEEHRNIHDANAGVVCPSCSATFNSHANYTKHFKKKHPELLTDRSRAPAPIKQKSTTSDLVTIDTRTVISQSQQQEDSMDELNNVTNTNVPTPLTGQNLSITPNNSNTWTPDTSKQQQPSNTITFHQHMNGMDLVDCAIQSALINEELEQCHNDEREPPPPPQQNVQLRETESQSHHDHQMTQHDPNQPMELCYKSLTSEFQDMPMQLTKVLQQSGPLELCVRNEHEYQLMNVNSGRDGNFGGSNSIDLTSFQQQPIDLISRNEVCNLNHQQQHMNSSVVANQQQQQHMNSSVVANQQQQHHSMGTVLIQGNNLVDLSLRSTLIQEQSTSSFIRELLDLSARSEYHDQQEQPMELNLSCQKSHSGNLQVNHLNTRVPINSHYNNPSIQNNVEYSDVGMFNLQNYTN